jgi:hypothetical protein
MSSSSPPDALSLGKPPLFSLSMGFGASQSGRCEEVKQVLFVQEIEPWFLGRPQSL